MTLRPLFHFHLGLATAVLALAGCSPYSTPVVQPSTANSAPIISDGNGVSGRSGNPLNTQSDPRETTGSVGGSPGGTSSAQTVPSSSNGVR